MRKRSWIIYALLVACGPKDVIPAGPTHPANPEAPASQTADGAPAEVDKGAIAAAEQAAFAKAKPVFEKHCARCHSSKGEKASKKKLDHFDMDTYPFGGHHATEIGGTIREVLGATG